jgi:hypothetical protein
MEVYVNAYGGNALTRRQKAFRGALGTRLAVCHGLVTGLSMTTI